MTGSNSTSKVRQNAWSMNNMATPSADKKRAPRPNYNKLHARPLPLITHPLPAFLPHNPLSLLRIAYALLSELFTQPSSHAEAPYEGYFSPETRSVHITDPKTVRALWEQGFFGKGTLSRSEPAWLEREKRRRGLTAALTSEEYTQQRREERLKFKQERARAQREALEEQLRKEEGAPSAALNEAEAAEIEQLVQPAGSEVEAPVANIQETAEAAPPEVSEEPIISNEEHLQLTLEEAFFLSYGLGALQVIHDDLPLSNTDLLSLCRCHSSFPPSAPDQLQPDDPFLLSYATYHHFRSLGWVVRPALKFAGDFMLYARGPVFAHAEFVVVVLPSYSHAYWKEPERRKECKRKEERSWWWLHCVNRVQGHVFKSLVLCYVEVPPLLAGGEGEEMGEGDVGGLLGRYRVREFVVKRWVANRSRD
ncbi:tRNA splicing endonuclease subunit sen2 [Coniosporium apollinis]|uniref:tRNA-splicing endonuclease subunit Sen2 n=1 Tax=Coniosporium apollinis TaxID=61459 RepID=A0ABQ9NQK0_9PEZI|nr:tRNA splicing endonuclease subunit sen2 [Coniosporium apollinis]